MKISFKCNGNREKEMISDIKEDRKVTAFYKGIASKNEAQSNVLKDERFSLTKPLNKSTNFGGKDDINGSIRNEQH